MTTHRGWVVAALVAAVLLLVSSVGVALLNARTMHWGPAARVTSPRLYAPMGGGMMAWRDDEANLTADQAAASARTTSSGRPSPSS